MVEGDVLPFVGDHSLDCAPHQHCAGGLAVGFIFGGHIFAVGQETELPRPISVLEAEFSVLDVYDILDFDGVGKT